MTRPLLLVTSQAEVEVKLVVKHTVPVLTTPVLNVKVDDVVDEEVDSEEVDVDALDEVVLVTEDSVVDDVVLEVLSEVVEEVEVDVEEVEDVVDTVEEASWVETDADEETCEEEPVVVDSALVVSLSAPCANESR
ncbi:unnamed protein product [Clonostachys rosea]|uniref:Uncharacterized protein n=1 Tax=Bionectria ochroleuca TaxID=29856 RepID=A0ABY6UU60_BIOOC|nr:unnamed protein product [Clonostachys rosea]